MLKLTIGNKNYSSWSLRPWILLEHAGIPFEENVVPLYVGDYKQKLLAESPAGKAPILRDGEIVVWDSLAICEYVAERFPEKRLWPVAPAQRAVARAISAEMHSGFVALRNAMPMNCRREKKPLLSIPADAQADITRITSMWRELRTRAHGPFLFGDFSVADAMYAPVVNRFSRYAVTLGEVEQAYVDAILALPAMKKWYAAAQTEPHVIQSYEV